MTRGYEAHLIRTANRGKISKNGLPIEPYRLYKLAMVLRDLSTNLCHIPKGTLTLAKKQKSYQGDLVAVWDATTGREYYFFNEKETVQYY